MDFPLNGTKASWRMANSRIKTERIKKNLEYFDVSERKEIKKFKRFYQTDMEPGWIGAHWANLGQMEHKKIKALIDCNPE